MRPNTREFGIFSTKRNKPVSTSMLTRMFVPNPKKAFQSLATHKVGLRIAVAIKIPLKVAHTPPRENEIPGWRRASRHRSGRSRNRQSERARHPPPPRGVQWLQTEKP